MLYSQVQYDLKDEINWSVQVWWEPFIKKKNKKKKKITNLITCKHVFPKTYYHSVLWLLQNLQNFQSLHLLLSCFVSTALPNLQLNIISWKNICIINDQIEWWHFPFRIVRKLNQDDPEFWNKVMNYVRTKTIEECQEHFYTAMSSRKRPSKPQNSAKGLYLMFRLINFYNIKPYPSVKDLKNHHTLKVWLCSEFHVD